MDPAFVTIMVADVVPPGGSMRREHVTLLRRGAAAHGRRARPPRTAAELGGLGLRIGPRSTARVRAAAEDHPRG